MGEGGGRFEQLTTITAYMKTVPQYERYIRPIQNVALTRLMQQVR